MTPDEPERASARARVERLRSMMPAAQAAQLREQVRVEEADRLAKAASTPASTAAGAGASAAGRERAARAYAGLSDYFAIASVSERQYDADNSLVQALEDAIAALGSARADPRHADLAPDRRVVSALMTARLLRQRYEMAGADEDLSDAVDLAEQAVGAARADARELLAEALALLGEQLSAAFDRDAGGAQIDRGVAVLREAYTLGGAPAAGGISRAAVSLAAALLLRAKARGGLADLDEAVGVLRRALAAEPTARVYDALGCVLIARAEQSGLAADLDSAVSALEQAVTLAPGDPWFSANLAVALRARFIDRGDQADEQRAAQLLQRSLSQIPEAAPDRLRVLHNATPPAEESPPAAELVARARALLAGTPAGARARPARQAALALHLMNAFQDTKDRALLTEALAVSEDGLRAAGRGSVDRPNLLGQKARALLLSYAVADAGEEVLGRAIATADEALTSAPAASAERGAFALTLAQAWTLRAAASGDARDAGKASKAFATAADLGRKRSPGTALAASLQWGAWATEEQRWSEAADAFDRALDAAEDLYRRQVGRSGREQWLKAAPGLAADAAVANAKAGRAQRAVLAIERGRARMLSDALDRDRAQVGGLRDGGRSDLAERFTQAAADLAARERGQHGTAEDSAARYSAAKASFDAVVAEIQALDGYRHFLAAPVFADVAAAAKAAQCPLVYLAAGVETLVAAVRPDGRTVLELLPDIDDDATLSRVAGYLSASRQRGADPQGWRAELTRVIDWLGDAIWPAVLKVAGPCDRVVLIPTGLLGLLPLHAAGRLDPAAPTGRRYALDDVVVTYAPNARALQASCALTARVDGDSVLAVGAPAHVGQPPLRFGDREAELVRAAFPAGRCVPARDATKQKVMDALGQFGVLHFACHGRTDLFDPLAGGLLLAGEDALTLGDILGLRLPGVRLAILSACESAVAGAALPDEVISLPAGLLQAGCAGVIGSLWSVPDASTMVLMGSFVRHWRQRSAAPAQALRLAQQSIRDASNQDLAAMGAPGLGTPPADPRLAQAWAARRPYAHPQAWAAFTYLGA